MAGLAVAPAPPSRRLFTLLRNCCRGAIAQCCGRVESILRSRRRTLTQPNLLADEVCLQPLNGGQEMKRASYLPAATIRAASCNHFRGPTAAAFPTTLRAAPRSASFCSIRPPPSATSAATSVLVRTQTTPGSPFEEKRTPASAANSLPRQAYFPYHTLSAWCWRLADAAERVMETWLDLGAMADQVLVVCGPETSRRHVLVDLEVTRSAATTLNRIFDGTFLSGTWLDPSTAASSFAAAAPAPKSWLAAPLQGAGSDAFSELRSPPPGYEETVETQLQELQEEENNPDQMLLVGRRAATDSVPSVSSDTEIDLTLSAKHVCPVAPPGATHRSLADPTQFHRQSQKQPMIIVIDSSDPEGEADGEQSTAGMSFCTRTNDDRDGLPIAAKTSTATNLRLQKAMSPAVVHLSSDMDDLDAGARFRGTDVVDPPSHTSFISSSQPQLTSVGSQSIAGHSFSTMDEPAAGMSRSNSMPPNPSRRATSIFLDWNVPSDSDSEGLPDLPLKSYIEDSFVAARASQRDEINRFAVGNNVAGKKQATRADEGNDDSNGTRDPATGSCTTGVSRSTSKKTAADAETNAEEARPAKKRQGKVAEDAAADFVRKETLRIEKEQKKLALEREKQERRLAKEAERIRKKEEKERARIEKAALTAANRLMTRKEAVLDMIIEVDAGWKARSLASKELDTLVEALGCEMFEDPNPPLPGLVRWRRKHKVVWNETENRFDPLPPDRCYVAEEKFRAVIIAGENFVSLCEGPVAGSGGAEFSPPPKLEAQVAEFRARYPDGQLAYFVEGLEKHYRKMRSAENRLFTSAVRGIDSSSQERSVSAGPSAASLADKDRIENALCWLQVFGKVKVVMSDRTDETVAWFKAITRELAILPFGKRQGCPPGSANFCADQVRSGATHSAVWQRCLEEVHLVTPTIARAIMRKYPTLRSLYDAFVECERRGGKPETVLADIQIQRGTPSDSNVRRLGPALSARLYQIFRLTDPTTIIA